MEDCSNTNDPYIILGVKETVTDLEIRKAYLKLAKVHHPDSRPHATEQERQASNHSFSRTASAYEVLSDEEKRKDYDKTRNLPR